MSGECNKCGEHCVDCICKDKGVDMPCMCWFEPDEGSKKLIKNCCQQIVDEINRLEKIGDPLGISIDETKKLLDHLYKPETCEENDS